MKLKQFIQENEYIKKEEESQTTHIKVHGAREHNLKNISVEIPKNEITVVTGVSGSGKSTLTQSVLFAEGQRRYLESLSSYARQFLGQMQKPDVDSIDGLSPAISIDQKTTSKNPRSTVGTISEVYDYLRVAWARVGTPTCPECGREIEGQSKEEIVDKIMELEEGTRLTINGPLVMQRKGEYKDLLERLRGEGFQRVKIDGEIKNLEEDIKLDKKYKHDIDVVVDRIKLKEKDRHRISESVDTALQMGEGLVKIDLIDEQSEGKKNQGKSKTRELLFSQHFSCPIHGSAIPELEPRIFSFNSPYGACQKCTGLGFQFQADPDLIIDKNANNLYEATRAWRLSSTSGFYNEVIRMIAKKYNININQSWKKLTEQEKDIILRGPKGGIRLDTSFQRRGRQRRWSFLFEGILTYLEDRYYKTDSDYIKKKVLKLMSLQACSECHGMRLRPEVLAVKLGTKSISEFTELSIEDSLQWIDELELSEHEYQIGRRVLKEIRERLQFLNQVGLGYLTLARSATTLSGGENQRLRLSQSLGSALSGVLVLLDEPSIGLHQHDNDMLLTSLKNLRDIGNTVVIVEHDEQHQREAEYLIEIGPRAGEHGGEIIAEGTPKEIIKNKKSLTGQYLSGERFIPIPERRKEKTKKVAVKKAKANNLKEINIDIPTQKFIGVCGVSGSGKSSLVNQVIYKNVQQYLSKKGDADKKYNQIKGAENFDKIIQINQAPIGRTPRSNPATYTKLFDHIRELFASTQDSRQRGYSSGRFSFNVPGGRCETCKGDGTLTIEMHFLPDIEVPCSACQGTRYTRETLEVRFKGKNIADVLAMPVEEALQFFAKQPKIKRRLQTLEDVGLGYIRLGQPATELSGGEAQRVKLANELAKVATGSTLYILDEPTTGLATYDIEKLLATLQRLVDQKNTVLVIEHNLDVLLSCDHLIDLGPFGGARGGELVASGSPEELAANYEQTGSLTGKFLQPLLKERQEKQKRQAPQNPSLIETTTKSKSLQSV